MGLIYLDSCLLIYLVENHPVWRQPVALAMDAAVNSRFGISALVACECLVGPLKRGDHLLERAYMGALARLVALPIPDEIYIEAARLRARFGLRTPDALHLACAQHHNCEALWTNDGRLARASHGLARNVLPRSGKRIRGRVR